MAEKISYEETVSMIRELSEAESKLKWSENQRVLMEVTVVRLCTRSLNSADIFERIKLLETRMSDLEKKLGGIPDQVRIQKPRLLKKVHTSDSIRFSRGRRFLGGPKRA